MLWWESQSVLLSMEAIEKAGNHTPHREKRKRYVETMGRLVQSELCGKGPVPCS